MTLKKENGLMTFFKNFQGLCLNKKIFKLREPVISKFFLKKIRESEYLLPKAF